MTFPTLSETDLFCDLVESKFRQTKRHSLGLGWLVLVGFVYKASYSTLEANYRFFVFFCERGLKNLMCSGFPSNILRSVFVCG